MKRIIHNIMFAATIAALVSCNTDDDSPVSSQLVVEGWIDSGRFPVVLLSRSVPVEYEFVEVDNLSNYIEKWATVKVSDGESEETLVGRYDDDYFPPYIYTTSFMRGVSGRTYKLTVDCTDGTHAEAVTTIPSVATADSFLIEPVASSDTLRQLYGYISDATNDNAYYKFFTHVLGEKYGYMSAYLGISSSQLLSSDGKIAVNKGRINIVKDFTPYFTIGDTVMVKLARIDSTAYSFWREFEDMTTLSRNPLFPVTNNLHSNIVGGMGYWFGYGSSFYSVIIK